jgi:hypothetical protein
MRRQQQESAMRVQIPDYTERWMRGDRYGEVVKVVKTSVPIAGTFRDVAHVRLDKSGKITRVLLDDCEVVS